MTTTEPKIGTKAFAAAADIEIIKRATKFYCVIPGKPATKRERVTLADARKEALKLAGVHLKTAEVFAVYGPGRQLLVPSTYQPDKDVAAAMRGAEAMAIDEAAAKLAKQLADRATATIKQESPVSKSKKLPKIIEAAAETFGADVAAKRSPKAAVKDLEKAITKAAKPAKAPKPAGDGKLDAVLKACASKTGATSAELKVLTGWDNAGWNTILASLAKRKDMKLTMTKRQATDSKRQLTVFHIA
jgi:hypothetical protein